MTLPKQAEVIFLLNRIDIKFYVTSEYVIRITDLPIEIRTYIEPDYDISFYPEVYHNDYSKFFVFYCKDIKELENNLLMWTRLL